jgi:hypothetical protein
MLDQLEDSVTRYGVYSAGVFIIIILESILQICRLNPIFIYN